MDKPSDFKNITDELHFSSLLDELDGKSLDNSDLAAAYLAGQIALLQRQIKEVHGLFDGEQLVGVVDTRDLEKLLQEKIDEYKATGLKSSSDKS